MNTRAKHTLESDAQTGRHAVVLGGSLAGLLTARVLSDHFERVTVIERETFESALQLGQSVLRELGFGAYRARQAAQKFRVHNIQSLHAVYPYYKDQEQFISMARQSRDELNEMFARDLAALEEEKSIWNDGDKLQ